jgi:hypothetical protein
MLVWWREKLTTTVESTWKRKRGVMKAGGSDTKFRRSKRLNLLVSQSFFIFICVEQYTIVNVEITTLE